MNSDASVISTRAAFDRVALEPQALAEVLADGTCKVTGGDAAKVAALFTMFEDFALMFDIGHPARAIVCVYQIKMSQFLPFRNVTVGWGRAAGGRGALA
jgi:hypothetical protein